MWIKVTMMNLIMGGKHRKPKVTLEGEGDMVRIKRCRNTHYRLLPNCSNEINTVKCNQRFLWHIAGSYQEVLSSQKKMFWE